LKPIRQAIDFSQQQQQQQQQQQRQQHRRQQQQQQQQQQQRSNNKKFFSMKAIRLSSGSYKMHLYPYTHTTCACIL
jgi:hypothetical protein